MDLSNQASQWDPTHKFIRIQKELESSSLFPEIPYFLVDLALQVCQGSQSLHLDPAVCTHKVYIHTTLRTMVLQCHIPPEDRVDLAILELQRLPTNNSAFIPCVYMLDSPFIVSFNTFSPGSPLDPDKPCTPFNP